MRIIWLSGTSTSHSKVREWRHNAKTTNRQARATQRLENDATMQKRRDDKHERLNSLRTMPQRKNDDETRFENNAKPQKRQDDEHETLKGSRTTPLSQPQHKNDETTSTSDSKVREQHHNDETTTTSDSKVRARLISELAVIDSSSSSSQMASEADASCASSVALFAASYNAFNIETKHAPPCDWPGSCAPSLVQNS